MRTTKSTLNEKEMELVKHLIQECRTSGGIQEKLKRLFAGTIEQMLKAEMEEHQQMLILHFSCFFLLSPGKKTAADPHIPI